MSRTFQRCAVAVGLAAVALTGCGSGGGADTTADRPEPRAAIANALQQSKQVGSSRFSVTSKTSFGGQDVSFTAEGLFDYEAMSGELTLTLPNAGGELRQRVLGDNLYLELPNEPGVFYELKLSELVDTSLAGATDPTAGLQALEGVSDDVTEVGREQVRGDDTTHYRGTLDVQKSLEALKGPLRDILDQALAAGEVKDVPFDAYIDDDGRLRQLDQTLTIENPKMPGQTIDVTTELEVYDFGVDVQVEKPPADAVRDGAPLLDAFRGLGDKPAS